MNYDVLHAIRYEINRRAENKSRYPINIGEHDGQWTVNIEVNSTAGTFDVETTHVDLTTALRSALAQIKRQFGTP